MSTQAAPPETKTDLKQKNSKFSKSKATIWLAVTLLIGISSIGYSIWSNRNPHYLTLVTKPISKYRKSVVIQYPENWKVEVHDGIKPIPRSTNHRTTVRLTPRPLPNFIDLLESIFSTQSNLGRNQTSIDVTILCDDLGKWDVTEDELSYFTKGVLAGMKEYDPAILGTLRKIPHFHGSGLELDAYIPPGVSSVSKHRFDNIRIDAEFKTVGCGVTVTATAPERSCRENNRIAHEIFKRLRVISTDR